MNKPPDDPTTGEQNSMSDDRDRYRLLTGLDDHAFCVRVSEALNDGYVLYGSPAITYNAATGSNVVAQAVILDQG